MRDFLELVRLVFRLSLANSRAKTWTALALVIAGQVALPLIAVALRFFTNSMLSGNKTAAALAGAGLVGAWIARLTFWHFAYRFYFDLLDLNTISFDEELITLVNEPAAIAHLERADFADKLEMIRADTRELYWSFSVVVAGFSAALQVTLTAVVLATLAPELLVVPVFAVPALLAGQRGQQVVDAARERTAERRRLSRHLLGLFCSASAAKEIRGFGLQRYLSERAAALWREISVDQWRAERRAMALGIGGQAIFGLAYIGALLFLVARAVSGHASVGDVLLVVALTGQINQQLSSATHEVLALHRLTRAIGRYRWVREQAAIRPSPRSDQPASTVRAQPPDRLKTGIEFQDVCFSYPGGTSPALSGVNLLLPAGSIIGLVGDNGSGKSTLLKLLAGFYEPTTGTITVDGASLADMSPAAWRARTSAAWQDFQRFELLTRESVGVGDLARIREEPVVAAALGRASTVSLADSLPDGLSTQLGKTYADGHELSGGQWQTVALARSMMRETPLVLILDEPTASLDASAEYFLFERYAQRAREVAHRNGGLCVLVSHRFSTVRMADLIVVIDNGQVREIGTHEALMRRDDLYATLYRVQAGGYD